MDNKIVLLAPLRSTSGPLSPAASGMRQPWDLHLPLESYALTPKCSTASISSVTLASKPDSPSNNFACALMPPNHHCDGTPGITPRTTSLFHSHRSFTKAALTLSVISMKRLAFGDDSSLQDRWRDSASFRESGSVMPADDVYMRKPSMFAAEGQRQSARTLVWYYLQTFLYSIVVAAPVYPVVYGLSRISWHVNNPDLDAQPVFLPNGTAIQWALFMQCVVSLALYAIILYMATNATLQVPRQLLLAVTGVIALALLAVSLSWHFKLAVWYYYLDLLLIALVFVPTMCMVGWLSAGPDATLKQRTDEVIFVALLEALLALSTLIYTTFLMPLFFNFDNAWLQMLWLCIIHPLYYELTTSYIVRKALHRNVKLGRKEIVHYLPIVHAMVHMVALNITLQASIEPLRIIAISAVLFNLGKLIWRSTVLYRDLFMERLLRWNWSYVYDPEDRLLLCHMISVSVLTELILENAAIMTAPFMLWCMYKEPIFMSVVPDTFFNNDGTYPVMALVAMVSILFSITWCGDLVFFAMNYYMGQKLPIIYSWRKIKEGKWAYLGFLTYALATMGVMFSFSMMLILPRAAYCNSNNYCDCYLPAYKAICRGEYVSTMVDYLISPRG